MSGDLFLDTHILSKLWPMDLSAGRYVTCSELS